MNKYKLDPSTGINEIIDQIKNQLLGSDLIDSTVPGTGIQRDLNAEVVSEIKGPVMVELLEMMEVGIPAFDLMQVRQARLDHERYQHDEEEITPMPQYPRKVIDCTLSDGSQVFVGIEYVKPFPELDLVQTRLGLKVSNSSLNSLKFYP